MTEEIKIKNGLGFKLSLDQIKLFAVVRPCTEKIELTVERVKQRLEEANFADLFIHEHLLLEFIAHYNRATEESFETEIGERRDARCEITISESKMQARLILTPNYGGKPATLLDVKKQLEEKKIVYGLAPISEVKALFTKKGDIDFVIASGLEPVPGIDTQFESLLLEAHERKPLIDENGDVDYRELGDIVIVHKDDVLMRRIPPIPGKKGRNVLGEIIEPHDGLDIPFSSDKKGAYLNPQDSNQLLSNISGQPVPVPHGMIVLPVLTVKNVDFASGNIRFDGSVVVLGDVEVDMKVYALEDITIDGNVTDAKIECMGNILVKGCVTGDSVLTAHGAINVIGGVQGHNEISDPIEGNEHHTAVIKSNSSILLGFAENFYVEASVDIVIEKYAMNCQLMAGNKIVTGAKNSGKKPSIMGGITWALMMVKGTILGSNAGIKTHIQVGTNPYVSKKIMGIKKDLIPNDKEQKDIDTILKFVNDHPEKGNPDMLEQLHHTLSKLTMEAELMRTELAELQSHMMAIEDAKVVADRGVYTGTEIRINNYLWKAQENRGKSVFRVEHREITINVR